MRILIDYRPALRQRTGVGEYVHEVSRALLATAPVGESLTLFSASWKDRLAPGVLPGAETSDHRIPVSLLNWAWHRGEWPPIERLTGHTFDVVQSLHPLLIPTTRAAQLVMVHDLDFLDHPERTTAEIRRDYPRLAADHARRADHVIANSLHTATAVESRLGVPRSRISICPPGAPHWTPRVSEPASDGCILFLGTITARKNIDVLLDAYEQLVGAGAAPPLVIAGQAGQDAALARARTQRPPLAGHVEWPGYITEDQKQALYGRALVFVLPSHTEGFGMPVLEAMMAGVPVIAANRGALPEAVGDAGRLFDPTSAADLTASLSSVLSDPAERRRMIGRGRRHAEQFTWTRTAQAMRTAWAHAIETCTQRHA